MPSTARALFVLGSPRSGTTLVAGILNQLPGVWIGKETGFIPGLYDVGLESLHEWEDSRLEVLVEAVNAYLRPGHWSTVASVRGVRRFWSETGATGYAGFIRYIWSLGQAPDGRERLVAGDQTPTYVLALPLLEQLFPEAVYVHVVRDPRDVVSSILPLQFGARSAAVAASDWNECVAGWWAAERRVPPERRCELRYEDLVTDPATTLQELAGLLRVAPPDPGGEAFSTDVHGLAGVAPHHRRLRLPIDDRSVGRHRRDLCPRDRDLVEAITYTGLVTYGYETGPFRPSPVFEEDALLLTRERFRDLRRRAWNAALRRRPHWR